MIIKALAIATVAAGALSTAALAQQDSPLNPNTVNPPSVTDQTPLPSQQSTLPPERASTALPSDVVAISADQARAQGIPVEMVASAPVPDTSENRAKYGGPMSNAGKNTSAKGN